MEPFSVSVVLAGINTAIKFAEYSVRIGEVGTENEVYVRTIQVVRNDLREAQRLLSVESVQRKLIATPGKLEWIKNAIESTKTALCEFGKHVERARVDYQATGTIKFGTRVRWVFADHEKLVNRTTELSACHQQLSNILAYITPLEEAVVSSEPPSFDDVTCFDDLISPRQRRMHKLQEERVYNTNTKMNTGHPKQTFLHREADELSSPRASTESSPTPMSPNHNSGIIEASGTATGWAPHLSSVSELAMENSLTDSELPPYAPDQVPRHAPRPHLSAGASDSAKYCWRSTDGYAHTNSCYSKVALGQGIAPWTMCGINSSGPVDPLELLYELPEAVPPSKANSSNLDGIFELPNDTKSTEPLQIKPGPPPGYPGYQGNLSAVQKVADHTAWSTNFPIPIQELEAPNPPFMPLHIQTEAPERGLSLPPADLAGWADAQVSIPQVLSPPTPFRGYMNATPSIETTSLSKAEKKPTGLSTRRQNQKSYMDMLGSLDITQ